MALPFSGVDVLEHHLGELVVGDLSVTVLIDLLDDGVDDRFVQGLPEGKDLLDLVGGNGTATVLVEHLEGSLQLVRGKEVLLVHGGNHEFGVLDLTIAVLIDTSKHVIDLVVRKGLTEELLVAVLDLLLGQLAVAVDVHGSENLVDFLLLLFGEQLRRDESVSGLLQLGLGVEAGQVVQSRDGGVGVELLELGFHGTLDPRVLKSLLGRGSLSLVLGKQSGDEVLGLVGDGVPDWV